MSEPEKILPEKIIYVNPSPKRARNFIDRSGQKFGRLTVIRLVKKPGKRRCYWECLCDCGKIAVRDDSIANGKMKSCGCFLKEIRPTFNFKHGHAKRHFISPEYETWSAMIHRCTNPNYDSWHLYGGRGIKVCERWLKFENFLEDVGTRPIGKSLDRYPDQNGDYAPGNVRWATRKEQANNMRVNHILEFNGESLTLSQWTDRLGFRIGAIRARISKGWSVERALTTPSRGKFWKQK